MEKAVWYYEKNGEKAGPISHDALQSMLRQGDINPATKVWTASLDDWVTISEVEHFNLSSLDEACFVETSEKEVDYVRETDETFVRPRPWVRFWARMLDYSLLFLIFGLFGIYSWNISPLLYFPFVVGLCFIWIFIETLLMTFWGATPGKWLLRIRVRDEFQQRLGFLDLLNRSFSVWWLGMGAGIPLIAFITMIVASVKLSNTGFTSWDKRNKYSVSHGNIGVVRILITVVYFICYFWFFPV